RGAQVELGGRNHQLLSAPSAGVATAGDERMKIPVSRGTDGHVVSTGRQAALKLELPAMARAVILHEEPVARLGRWRVGIRRAVTVQAEHAVEGTVRIVRQRGERDGRK